MAGPLFITENGAPADAGAPAPAVACFVASAHVGVKGSGQSGARAEPCAGRNSGTRSEQQGQL